MVEMLARKSQDELPDRAPIPVQLERLQSLRAAWGRPQTPFQPGDHVRLKDGMGTIKDKLRPTIALMFWRYLDQKDHVDKCLISKALREDAAEQVDCVVTYLCNDGHCLIHDPMSSRELQLWEPPAGDA